MRMYFNRLVTPTAVGEGDAVSEENRLNPARAGLLKTV